MYGQVKIKRGRERSFLNRHPWVFSGAIGSTGDCTDGGIAEVVSCDGDIIGYGFYSDKTGIACRLFEFTRNRIEEFPPEYFHKKISDAAKIRSGFINRERTDCYRLVNAEGDFLPGLIVDIYNDTAVLQVNIKGIELILDIIAGSLADTGIQNICVKNPDSGAENNITPGFNVLKGDCADTVYVKENNLRFTVDIKKGQKTGFFLDQRDNRELVRWIAAGKNILNAFSYTGGFSIYAMSGWARSITSVDISQDALSHLDENIRLNPVTETLHSSVRDDCFSYLRTMDDDLFDLIILDPPAFVKSAAAIDRGARGYKDINMNAMKKIRKDSMMLTFSCSQHVSDDLFQKIIFAAAADAGRNVRVLKRLSRGEDHPVSIYHPEGEYLKGYLLHVE